MSAVDARRPSGAVVLAVLGAWIGAAYAAFNWGVYSSIRIQSGKPLVEESFGYEAVDIAAQSARLGPIGRLEYLHFQALDLVIASLGFAAVVLCVGWLASRLGLSRRSLISLSIAPCVMYSMEWMENALLAVITVLDQNFNPFYAVVASTATQVKLLTAAISASMLLVMSLALVWRAAAKPREASL
ncbi:MAG: hypothetical protein JNM76_07150 [Betaproteobacteria bacterium]|nr:hypothetical protein [Betaproteobacteria bacterium]